MMISPETFYDEYLKGKSEREIHAIIYRLKRDIGHLKSVMEHPNNAQIIFPGQEVTISCYRKYLERAKQALAEVGGTYTPSHADLRAIKFNANIPFISRVEFCIEGYTYGGESKVITIEDNKATATVHRFPLSFKRGAEALTSEEEMDKDTLLEGLSELYIGEWLNKYDPIRFNYISSDGIQWHLNFYFSNGNRRVRILGYNDYPYNFARLLEVLQIKLFSIKDGFADAKVDTKQGDDIEPEKKALPVEYSDECIRNFFSGESDSERSFEVVTSSEFYAAVKCIVNEKTATIYTLQRRLSMNYGRASVMLDYMEDLGLIRSAFDKSADNILPNAKQFLDDRSKLT